MDVFAIVIDTILKKVREVLNFLHALLCNFTPTVMCEKEKIH